MKMFTWIRSSYGKPDTQGAKTQMVSNFFWSRRLFSTAIVYINLKQKENRESKQFYKMVQCGSLGRRQEK